MNGRRQFFSMLMAAVPWSVPLIAGAEGAVPNKDQYHLFFPTPVALMRDLSTDRPDKTESPFTVDAGHFQIEADLVSYVHDRDRSSDGDVRTDAWSIAPVNLKVGLLNDLDFQLIVETYNRVRIEDRITGSETTRSGFGDLTLRLKKNFWGNDGGATAFGVMPFLKMPASRAGLGNRSVEGGVILPWAVSLPSGWDMGGMTEVDCQQAGEGDGHHASFINLITFSHAIVGRLGGYVEFFSETSTEQNVPWVGTVDFGLTYKLTPGFQLDAGVNVGVTKSADDVNPFVGFSRRF
jgi:hypothetical protein